MNLVILTNRHGIVDSILRDLEERKIDITAVFIEKIRHKKRLVNLKIFIREILPDFIMILLGKALNIKPVPEWNKIKYYRQFTSKVFVVRNFNDSYTERLLRDTSPDLIVLAGSRILRKSIIEIPSIGVLNAHPGLLPEYRGVDVVPWAIYNNDPVGVTVHFVDEGIDTGKICKQQIIEFEKDENLSIIREKAEKISSKLLVETVMDLKENKSIHIISNERTKGRQYYRMDREKIDEVESRLKERIYGRKD